MLCNRRDALRQHRAQIAATAGAIRYACRLTLKRIADSHAGRRQEQPANAIRSCARGSLLDAGAISRADFANVLWGEEKVLRAVQSHPEGIKLIEVGNEVGVDWRRLVRPAHTLTDAGRIDQVEELFYPIA